MNIAQFLAMYCNLKIKGFQSGVDVGSLQQFARDAQHGVFCGFFRLMMWKALAPGAPPQTPMGKLMALPHTPFLIVWRSLVETPPPKSCIRHCILLWSVYMQWCLKTYSGVYVQWCLRAHSGVYVQWCLRAHSGVCVYMQWCLRAHSGVCVELCSSVVLSFAGFLLRVAMAWVVSQWHRHHFGGCYATQPKPSCPVHPRLSVLWWGSYSNPLFPDILRNCFSMFLG